MDIKHQAYELFMQGMSYGKIGRKLEIGKTTAFDYVKEMERRLSGNQLSTSRVRSNRKDKKQLWEKIDPIIESNGLMKVEQAPPLYNLLDTIGNSDETVALFAIGNENIPIAPSTPFQFTVPLLNVTPQSKKEVAEFMQKYRNKSRDESIAILADSLKTMTRKEGIIAASVIGVSALFIKLLSAKKVNKDNPESKAEETELVAPDK